MTNYLLHVGYPKAGSTFLQRWFASHPELRYRPGSFAGFASTGELVAAASRPAAPPVRWLVTSDIHFALWHGPLEPLGMQPAGHDVKAHQRRVCELLAALQPEATVLAVTRGWASLARSAHSQYLRAGGVHSWDDFLAAMADHMVDFWDFDHLLALYRGAFGPARVIVLPYELLRFDGAGFVRTLERRLGLAPHPWPGERINPGLDEAQLAGTARLSRAVLATLRPLPRRAQLALYGRYTRGLGAGRWSLLARAAGRRAAAAPSPRELPPELLRRFAGRASTLAAIPDFAPFLDCYLETAVAATSPAGSPPAPVGAH